MDTIFNIMWAAARWVWRDRIRAERIDALTRAHNVMFQHGTPIGCSLLRFAIEEENGGTINAGRGEG
jgi:hypothetical protein